MGTALTWGCFAAAGCADDGGGGSDGGGGAGGSGTVMDASDGEAGVVGCVTTAPTACPTPPVTYAIVQPILQARCVSVCHNDRTIDPNTNMPIWGFTDYDHVATWADTIRDELFKCSMPPPDAGVPITVDERRAILEFIRCGLPK